jgi:glycosyltransferase involved in cell wall biosynthesis
MKPKIALSMIVKDEVDELKRCLDSIAPYVDGIFVLQTKKSPPTDTVLRGYNAITKQDYTISVSPTKKERAMLKDYLGWEPEITTKDRIFPFDVARNKALDMIDKTYTHVLWLDADDIFRGGEDLAYEVARMQEKNATSLYMKYLYEVELDEKGALKNILIEHLRERIVVLNGTYRWVAPIHETLIAQHAESRQLSASVCEVMHLSTHDKKMDNLQRNLKNLQYSLIKTKLKDPRPKYYLGKVYYDVHTPEAHDKAIKLILDYLEGESPSGWDEERAQAWEYLAEIYRAKKEFNKAMKCGLNALAETNKFPTTFLSLALTSLCKKKYEDALLYVKLAGVLDVPHTTLVFTPRDAVARALEILSNANLQLHRLDESLIATEKLLELMPHDEHVKNFYTMLVEMRDERELTKNYLSLARHIGEQGGDDKLKAFIASTPARLAGNPIIGDFLKKHMPARTWDKDEVAIYCGPGFTIWNPDIMHDPKGSFIGGSEEAVISIAKELSKKGYKVTVYNDPGKEGEYDGVTYKQYFTFNKDDVFNILIIWRMPDMLDNDFNAQQLYLWLHDVPNALQFTKERVDKVTKIMCLSKAQRACIPDVPNDKIFITQNGFTEYYPDVIEENNPKTCIWTSSYDRGLMHLLEIWPRVIKEVPQACLKVFYGWQLFDTFYTNNPERQAWKQKMVKLLNQKGIYEGGRIPQQQLELEYKQAGVWSYPTDFFEISCISAMKAQAFGAVPVCTNHAALKETVQHGHKVDGDIWDKNTKDVYASTLIEVLKNPPQRKDMMRWAKDTYTWKTTAKQWDYQFKKHKA